MDEKTETHEKEIEQARGLAKFFSVKVEIRVFGNLVWSYVWPPQKS